MSIRGLIELIISIIRDERARSQQRGLYIKEETPNVLGTKLRRY